MRIVGEAKQIYYSPSPALWCAPGTWGTWKPAKDGAQADASLTPTYYLTTGQEAAKQFVQKLVDEQRVMPHEALLRSTLLQDPGTKPQAFLALVSIAVALLAGLPLVLSSITASWVRHVQKAMSLAGVPPRLWLQAGVTTLLLASVACAMFGSLAGTLLSLAARPLFHRMNSGIPLAPWNLDLGWVAISAALAGLGAIAGFLITAWTARLQIRASTAVAKPLTANGVRAYAITGAALTVLSLGLIAASGGRLWDMAIAVVLGVAAAAAFAPVILAGVAHLLRRRPPGPASLAGRLFHADGRRWGTILVTTSVLTGLVVSVFVNISASAAAQDALLRSPIPRGMVVVETPDAEEEKSLVREMLSDTQAPDPIVAIRSDSIVAGEGNVILFTSLQDAITALGPLPPETTEALTSGAIIRPHGLPGTASVESNGHTREVRVTGYRPDEAHYLNLGYGYALTPESGEPGNDGRELLLLANLTGEQESALRDWPSQKGTSALTMHVHYMPSSAAFPLWLTMGFAILALLMSPVIFGIIRREVQQLKPLARDLDSLGLPRAWIRNVLATLTLVAVAVPLALSVAAAFVTTVALQWCYPPIFDTASANWPGVAVFALALLAAALVAARLGSRNLRKASRQHVL